jgi:hypothetical protein
MVRTWVVAHSLLTKLVRWSHVQAAAVDVDSAAAAEAVVVTVADSAAAVAAIAVVTAVETVGNLSIDFKKRSPRKRAFFLF